MPELRDPGLSRRCEASSSEGSEARLAQDRPGPSLSQRARIVVVNRKVARQHPLGGREVRLE